MMNNKKFTAVVIGLGKIGMGYDYSCTDDQRIMTHSSAYYYHPGYQLLAGVDPDLQKRKLFTKKYSLPVYRSIDEMYKEIQPEVYSLAVPTSYHYEMFLQLMNFHSKAILCEKPFADTLEKAMEMRELAKKKSILLFVNYMRRFGVGVKNIMDVLDKKKLGRINKVIVKYSCGFLNSATHFIDLIQYLFGKIDFVQRLQGYVDDNIDMKCRVSDIDVYFIAIDRCDYAIYELEIFGEQGVLRYYDAGRDIRCQIASFDDRIDDAKTLHSTPLLYDNDFDRFQWHVMDAMYQSLLKNNHHLSNVDHAVDVLKVASLALR